MIVRFDYLRLSMRDICTDLQQRLVVIPRFSIVCRLFPCRCPAVFTSVNENLNIPGRQKPCYDVRYANNELKAWLRAFALPPVVARLSLIFGTSRSRRDEEMIQRMIVTDAQHR